MMRRSGLLTSVGRRGFTLVELLITVSIVAIMASMVLFAMFQAQDAARAKNPHADREAEQHHHAAVRRVPDAEGAIHIPAAEVCRDGSAGN